jgi:signal transduction histidine kinase
VAVWAGVRLHPPAEARLHWWGDDRGCRLGYGLVMDVRPPQRRWLPRLPQQVADGLLGMMVAGLQLALLLIVRGYEGSRLGYAEPGALAVGLVVAQALPLVWRRRRPLLVLVVVLGANTVYYALGFPETGFDLALPIAVYSAAAYTDRRVSLLAAAVTVALFVGLFALKVGPFWATVPASFVAWLVAIFIALWVWGRYVQVRRAYTAELEARAERAERDREEQTRRAVAAERARIARELHDVVAHHIGVVVIQAGAGRRLLDSDLEQTRSALVAVEDAGRRALTAMPSLLRALRSDQADETRAPQPTLDDLDELVAQVTAAGLPVEVRIEGAMRPLPAGVDLSAYRIVQEALTNTLKHAGAARAHVTVCYELHVLTVTVVDDGVGGWPSDATGSGHGLVGMRERAMLFGGQLRAGPRLEGGFRVAVRFPLNSEPDAQVSL